MRIRHRAVPTGDAASKQALLTFLARHKNTDASSAVTKPDTALHSSTFTRHACSQLGRAKSSMRKFWLPNHRMSPSYLYPVYGEFECRRSNMLRECRLSNGGASASGPASRLKLFSQQSPYKPPQNCRCTVAYPTPPGRYTTGSRPPPRPTRTSAATGRTIGAPAAAIGAPAASPPPGT